MSLVLSARAITDALIHKTHLRQGRRTVVRQGSAGRTAQFEPAHIQRSAMGSAREASASLQPKGGRRSVPLTSLKLYLGPALRTTSRGGNIRADRDRNKLAHRLRRGARCRRDISSQAARAQRRHCKVQVARENGPAPHPAAGTLIKK